MSDLSALDWAALALAAVLVGFAKSAIAGAAAIPVALFAAVLPARESTGALLPLLIVGDLVAVGMYRRHADWGMLLRLFPAVAVGVLVGVAFVARVDDAAMRRTIGAVLLLLVAVHLWQQQRARRATAAAAPATAVGLPPSAPGATPPPAVTPAPGGRGLRTALPYGGLAGFTTMVANAAGPVMSLYLLLARTTMLGFLGTAAWFFLIVNTFKVPFSLGLGLISPESLVIDALLVPALVAGAVLGRAFVHRLDQARFERLILVFTVLASVNLIR